MEDFNSRCVAAVEKYLEMQGCDILTTNFTEKIDIVAIDADNNLRFIRVKGFKRAPQPEDKKMSSKLRAKMEWGMYNYINRYSSYIDISGYLDLALVYAADSMDRAFLTYVRDCGIS